MSIYLFFDLFASIAFLASRAVSLLVFIRVMTEVFFVFRFFTNMLVMALASETETIFITVVRLSRNLFCVHVNLPPIRP